jgi:CelD/BcsL family acetyltransferase involved in cellulose biosynthesis
MTLEVRRETLEGLAPEWEALLTRSKEPVPFQHPTWQRVWLDEFHNDREAMILSAREGNALIGVAPLMRDGEQLILIGHYSICDYMDFVVEPGRSGEALGSFIEMLDGEGWQEIELRGIRECSETLAVLPEVCAAMGLVFEREEESVAPRLDVPATWEEYIASLPKKDRHELRRKQRRLQAAGRLELQTFTRPEEVAEHLPQLLRFMVDSRSDKASFLTEQMGRFFHQMALAMAQEGLVRLYELELDGKAVASVLCFDQGGQLYLYNSGYDPDYASLAVGLISKALCMQDAIESGKHCVDFMRGREPYKYDLGGSDLTVYRCTVKRP